MTIIRRLSRLKSIARVIALLLAVVTIPATPSCAMVASYLPQVIAAAQHSNVVLDLISGAVEQFFDVSPNAEREKLIQQAIARTRSALAVALKVASGAEELNQAKVDAAFADFRDAYSELLVLIRPLGITSGKGDTLRAEPGGLLVVPEPMALTLRLRS